MASHRVVGLITSVVLAGPLVGACGGSDTSTGPSEVGGDSGFGGGTSVSTAAGGMHETGGGISTMGGGNATGGMNGAGGSVSTGGSTNSGGVAPTGGVAATGGSKAAGGAALTGGTYATGGSRATGGLSAASGMTSTGGSLAAGGTLATGGTKANGGVAATGGSPPATGGAKSTGGGSPTGGRSATGGGLATGGATSTSCTAPPAAPALVGFGEGTTGGGDAAPTTVTTLSALQSAVSGSTAAVVYVKGVLSAGNLTVGSNKTIAGVCGAEIHGHIEMSGSTNVILRNIKVVGYAVGNCSLDPDYDSSVGCSSGSDAMSVQKNANRIWIDHCDISDGTDGNLDITNAANNVTVSWTKFHYTARTDSSGSDSTGAAGHRYSNLVGGTDSPSSYSDSTALNVTWHHNWWADRVMERQPRVRFGKNHIFNNLYTSSGDNYCVRAGIQAHILLQNNVFSGVDTPHEFNNSSDQGTAYISSSGNVYTNCTGTQATGGGGTAFTSPSYSFTLDAANTVSAAVQSGAGPH
jgi:pectate lyase